MSRSSAVNLGAIGTVVAAIRAVALAAAMRSEDSRDGLRKVDIQGDDENII
jgi:hypothetical protein